MAVGASVVCSSQLAFAADGMPAPQAIAIVLNFAVFVGLIVVFGGKPLKAHFDGRRASIADAIEDSKKLNAAAQSRLDEYSARLDAFEREKEAILAEFREIGARESERLVSDARKQAERIRVDAEESAAREGRAAKAELESLLVERAVALATDDIRGRLNPMMQNRLVDRSIESFKALGQA